MRAIDKLDRKISKIYFFERKKKKRKGRMIGCEKEKEYCISKEATGRRFPDTTITK